MQIPDRIPDHHFLMRFVMDQAASQPNAVRVKLYRGLAKVCGSEQEAKQLEALASELAVAEKRSRELNFALAQEEAQ